MTALVVRDLGPGVACMVVQKPTGDVLVMNTRDRLAALAPKEGELSTAVDSFERVPVEVHPTSTPAADLPLGMVHDVAQVLRAHGLDPDLLALSSALYTVITATSVAQGGTAT